MKIFLALFVLVSLSPVHASVLSNEFADLYLDCKNKNYNFNLVLRHTPYRGITLITQNYFEGDEVVDSASKYFGFRHYGNETELVVSEKAREPGKVSDKKDMHYYLIYKNSEFFNDSFDAEILKSTGVEYENNVEKFQVIKCQMKIINHNDIGDL